MDLHEAVPTDWALVGGQMVHLHCAERGGVPPRPTDDADTVVDVRAQPDILLTFTAALADLGFTADTSGDGMQHRWKRDRAQIDVLIPEGTGQRAESRGGVHGAPTVAAPGTTQALARASDIEVEVAGRRGMVRRPSLVGALVGKAAARIDLGSGGASGRHCVDFVVLAGLLSASDVRDEALSPKDRKRLRLMLDVCTRDPAALSVENATENLQRLSLAAGLS
ncbi:hypothetical protein [Janibacter anophelis]